MVDSILYLDWKKKSKADLKSAEILFQYNGDNGIIAFHCQQAIEKILKGYLLRQDGKLRVSHSLLYLIQEASCYDKELLIFIKKCAMVNQYYIETRYPSEEPLIVSDEIAGECIKIAKEISDYLLRSDDADC